MQASAGNEGKVSKKIGSGKRWKAKAHKRPRRTERRRSEHDGGGGKIVDQLTEETVGSSMAPALFYEQPYVDRETIVPLLRPLKNGKPVVIAVIDSRMPKRKRLTGNPLLALVPSECFGGKPGWLFASLQAHGSELICIATGLKAISFYRLGMNFRLSSALAEALKRIYHRR